MILYYWCLVVFVGCSVIVIVEVFVHDGDPLFGVIWCVVYELD